MSDSVHPPSPSGPSLPTPDPPGDSGNLPPPAPGAPDAGSSNDGDVGTAPSLSLASSSASPSSSQQPSPSPSGAKYENTKDLKQFKDKLETLGHKSSWTEQSDYLRNSDATLTKHIALWEELLINLDATHSTTGIIYVINHLVEAAFAKKNDRDMMRASDILKNYVERRVLVREQVMAVADIYARLFFKITSFLLHKNELINGIPFLCSAIDVLVDPEEQTVTSLHGLLFTLCLKAHAIGPALSYLYPYVRGILSENNPSNSPSSMDSRGLLSYLYYGGLLAARATQWKRSTSLLKAACFVPGQAVSEIQIEALKKLHIISFIADGRMSLPNRSQNLVKAWKQQGTQYTQLAAELEGGVLSDWDDERAYEKTDESPSTEQIAERAKIVQKFLVAHRKVFEKDQNVELLQILQHECKLRAVLKVAQLYKVVSLPRITEMAKLENTEETKQVLTTLIEGGRLLVSDDGNDFVRLELPPVTQALPEINERQKRLTAITEDVKRLDLVAKKTSWYIQRTNKSGHPNDDEGLSMSNVPESFAAPAPTSIPMPT